LSEVPVEQIRLAELLAAFSLLSDLGMGREQEVAIGSCLIATELARRMDVPEDVVADTYYTALLQHIGCTAYSHETALLFGDDVALNAAGEKTDHNRPSEIISVMIPALASGPGAVGRARVAAIMLVRGQQFARAATSANCEVAAMLARRLGFGDGLEQSLFQVFESWNGKGGPRRLKGASIALAARLAQVGATAALFDRLGGPELAVEAVRRRSGTSLDPHVADVFARDGEEILRELADSDRWPMVLAAEPPPHRLVPESEVDAVAAAFGDLADLKSPFLHGHSAGVAVLAEAAGGVLGLPASELVMLRRAALLHDIGRVAISSSIWSKTGPLTTAEWEQARLHPYHTERLLLRSPFLAPLAAIAGSHHERLDGSGYPHATKGAALPVAARVLAAADEYDTMTHDRAHRGALPAPSAAEELRSMAARGQLDGRATTAVLTAAGHRPAGRSVYPGGLSDREVEVLGFMAQGLSTRVLARRLAITPKTADHHVQHIYTKLGISTRAAAAMFAMEHDLVGPAR
jgi:HD-GYP domain-containing protein (c-di-GMP phosphodiesterase class II)